MPLETAIGIAAGVCTSVASVPQIVTTIRKKKAADVSPGMFAVLLVGNSLWAFYGIIRSDIPVMVTNMVSVLLDLLMLLLRFRYSSNRKS